MVTDHCGGSNKTLLHLCTSFIVFVFFFVFFITFYVYFMFAASNILLLNFIFWTASIFEIRDD